MIEALVHGKLSREQENMEDILTSNVFGLLPRKRKGQALLIGPAFRVRLGQLRGERLFKKARLLGSYATTDRQRLRDLARERGRHHLDNLAATPA